MFTGLVEGKGTIAGLTPDGPGVLLEVEPPAVMCAPDDDPAEIGQSVAINGCCLTIISIKENSWAFQAGTETLSRTNLGELAAGDLVNLERSLRADARLGGHFVQGHIDGTATVETIDQQGEWVTMWFHAPTSLTKQMVSKGSVAIDGVSLTLVDVQPERFSIALIPHTLEVTTLGIRQVGQTVNVETDILGKYIEKMLGEMSLPPRP